MVLGERQSARIAPPMVTGEVVAVYPTTEQQTNSRLHDILNSSGKPIGKFFLDKGNIILIGKAKSKIPGHKRYDFITYNMHSGLMAASHFITRKSLPIDDAIKQKKEVWRNPHYPGNKSLLNNALPKLSLAALERIRSYGVNPPQDILIIQQGLKEAILNYNSVYHTIELTGFPSSLIPQQSTRRLRDIIHFPKKKYPQPENNHAASFALKPQHNISPKVNRHTITRIRITPQTVHDRLVALIGLQLPVPIGSFSRNLGGDNGHIPLSLAIDSNGRIMVDKRYLHRVSDGRKHRLQRFFPCPEHIAVNLLRYLHNIAGAIELGNFSPTGDITEGHEINDYLRVLQFIIKNAIDFHTGQPIPKETTAPALLLQQQQQAQEIIDKISMSSSSNKHWFKKEGWLNSQPQVA